VRAWCHPKISREILIIGREQPQVYITSSLGT
jgi:hypothetical protein